MFLFVFRLLFFALYTMSWSDCCDHSVHDEALGGDKKKDLRATKRNEDRRHGRLMKSAKQLSSKDLMEIAALKHFSESDLMKFADEMGITRASICNGSAQADEGHAPASASGMIRDAPHEEPPEEHAPEPAESRVMQAEDLEALR